MAQGPTLPPTATDGVSILPTLMGKTQPMPEYMFWSWQKGYSVRTGMWKGVVTQCLGGTGKKLQPSLQDKMELYDLGSDPHENDDISAANPQIVSKIRKMLVGKDLFCQCDQCYLALPSSSCVRTAHHPPRPNAKAQPHPTGLQWTADAKRPKLQRPRVDCRGHVRHLKLLAAQQ